MNALPLRHVDLPEATQLTELLAHPLVQSRVLATIDGLPLYELQLGPTEAHCPTLMLTAGVHGNEVIGSQILLAWLSHLMAQSPWDNHQAHLLSRVRLVILPMINVTGLVKGTRATAAGIDLMRNAPVEAEGSYRWPLAGQRLSRHLPWYRGTALAPENQALIESLNYWRARSTFLLAMDLHSGFGMTDRLWFPYAAHTRPSPHLAEAVALCDLFNRSYPLHDFYRIEPQSLNYTTHGDIWDYIYLQSQQTAGAMVLPFTLEMGSWLWLRKNPRQLFRPMGLFHPVLPHRLRRVLRRHWTLLDFLLRVTADAQHWLPEGEARQALHQAGLHKWYG